MKRPLSGRRALITGSTQGLGLAAAQRLAADGCDVVVHGLGGSAALDATRAGLERDHGVRALSSGADLRDPSQIAGLVSAALNAFGGIDILVNNAVTRHTGLIEEVTPADWDEAMSVNLSSAFHTIRLVVGGMKQRGWGRIINVSSIYGLRGAANLKPSELSGGMARRVALARAIALDPKLIMYDEPFTALDPISLGVVARLIRRLNDSLGATSIVVTHDVAETLPFVDHVFFMADGRVVAEGPPGEVERADVPFVTQFVQGNVDGAVPFHFPAPGYRADLGLEAKV